VHCVGDEMRKLVEITPDVFLLEKSVLAIVKSKEQVSFDGNGPVFIHNVYIYIKDSSIPIVIQTSKIEELKLIEEKLKENANE
jgi:hypothetical protein